MPGPAAISSALDDSIVGDARRRRDSSGARLDRLLAQQCARRGRHSDPTEQRAAEAFRNRTPADGERLGPVRRGHFLERPSGARNLPPNAVWVIGIPWARTHERCESRSRVSALRTYPHLFLTSYPHPVSGRMTA
jgi:hypothetical protein